MNRNVTHFYQGFEPTGACTHAYISRGTCTQVYEGEDSNLPEIELELTMGRTGTYYG